MKKSEKKELTEAFINLMLQIIHKIEGSAEHQIEKYPLAEFNLNGKDYQIQIEINPHKLTWISPKTLDVFLEKELEHSIKIPFPFPFTMGDDFGQGLFSKAIKNIKRINSSMIDNDDEVHFIDSQKEPVLIPRYTEVSKALKRKIALAKARENTQKAMDLALTSIEEEINLLNILDLNQYVKETLDCFKVKMGELESNRLKKSNPVYSSFIPFQVLGELKRESNEKCLFTSFRDVDEEISINNTIIPNGMIKKNQVWEIMQGKVNRIS